MIQLILQILIFREPQIAFNQRIEWCLDLHNQSVSCESELMPETKTERGGQIRSYPLHDRIFLTRAALHHQGSLMTWVVKILAQDRYGVNSRVRVSEGVRISAYFYRIFLSFRSGP